MFSILFYFAFFFSFFFLTGKVFCTKWTPLLTLKGHLSSVRCIAVTKLPHQLSLHFVKNQNCQTSPSRLPHQHSTNNAISTSRQEIDKTAYQTEETHASSSSIAQVKLEDEENENRNMSPLPHSSFQCESGDDIIGIQQEDFLIFTGGGRAEIRVWKLTCENSSDDNKKNISSCGGQVDDNVDIDSDLRTDKTAIKLKEEEEEDSRHEKDLKQYSSNVEGMTTVQEEEEVGKKEENEMVGKLKHDVKQPNTSCSNQAVPFSSDKDKGEAKVAEEATLICKYEELSKHFLGESRHKGHYSKWKVRKLRLDPETRVMSLASTCLSDVLKPDCYGDGGGNYSPGSYARGVEDRLAELHIVSAAGSDGILR